MNGNDLKTLREKHGFTQKELSDATQVPQGTISRFESSGEEIKKVSTVRIFEEFFKNADVFPHNGERKDPNDENGFPHPEHEYAKYAPKTYNNIPMYNFPASASDIEMYSDPNEVQIIGYLNLPGSIKGSFALPVYGHSMYPTLENGSWTVLRPIDDKQDIEWGEIYYIEYGDYRNFKRLLKADDDESVILWSDNQSELIGGKPKYSPKTIKLDRIKKLCLLTDIVKKPNY